MGLSSIDQSFVDAARCRCSHFPHTDTWECVNQQYIFLPGPSSVIWEKTIIPLTLSLPYCCIFLSLVDFIDWRNWLDEFAVESDWMRCLGVMWLDEKAGECDWMRCLGWCDWMQCFGCTITAVPESFFLHHILSTGSDCEGSVVQVHSCVQNHIGLLWQ